MQQLDFSAREFLRNIPLFSPLHAAEVSDLVRLSEPITLEAGDRLFAQGDPANGLYVVERGELEVSTRMGSGRDLVLAHLGNGSVVGEMALIDGGPRSATVEAVAQVQGYFLSRVRFDEMRAKGNKSAFKIIFRLSETLEGRRRQLAERIQRVLADPRVGAKLRQQATKELIAKVRKA